MKRRKRELRRVSSTLTAGFLATLLGVSAVSPQTGVSSSVAGGQWVERGGDKAATLYSPLDHIDASNVDQLRIAWRWTSVDEKLRQDYPQLNDPSHRVFYYEVTPLMVDGRVFASTSLGQIAEIDPATGKSVWSYDPQAWEAEYATNLGFLTRGLAYWRDGSKERLFHAAGDAKLVSVDPKTGSADKEFGRSGSVDLKASIQKGRDPRGLTVTSPPIVCRDTVIVGSGVFDSPERRRMPRGPVRAFDARTGAARWTFHTIPRQGELGYETWENDSAQRAGATNVWPPMSADDELGLVYLPVGSPASNWFGGHRPGDNLFAGSVVAVDCETGERAWHFQIVRHIIWDYDPPNAPNLIDVELDGQTIPAVAIVTKQGFVFVLDRRNGQPVWPIEDREVPRSRLPGEQTAKTQPFPTRPPPFEKTGIREEDLLDLTPTLHEKALDLFRRYESGPIYTPPSQEGTFVNPGWGGGGNWNGAAFDPETHMLYVPSFTEYNVVTMKKPSGRLGPGYDWVWSGASHPLIDDAFPIVKPPWGRITAYDMNRGEIVWQVATGDGARNHPELANLDLPPLGFRGLNFVLLTKTLLFATSDSDDWNPPQIRAFDKATGELLWEMELPSRTRGTPMTYSHKGRQYIVLPLGGGRGGKPEDRQPEELVALALGSP